MSAAVLRQLDQLTVFPVVGTVSEGFTSRQRAAAQRRAGQTVATSTRTRLRLKTESDLLSVSVVISIHTNTA